MATKLPQVTIYTDGAVKGNPGIGGWAARLEFASRAGGIRVKEVFGKVESVTNNQMELQAMVEGLAVLTRACRVTIITDSRCAILWTRNGPHVRNAYTVELWQRFNELKRQFGHEISFVRIDGHSGNVGNERVDRIAYAMARDLPLPEGAE